MPTRTGRSSCPTAPSFASSLGDRSKRHVDRSHPPRYVGQHCRERLIPFGVYRYSTTIVIEPGFDPSTASLSGFWWSDNQSRKRHLSQRRERVDFDGAFWFAHRLRERRIQHCLGVVAGVDVLTFYVTNTGGPGGTLIQGLTGNVTGNVPEPPLS